ncbi:PD-(D/E)XK nuclease family protein [Candidatus Woesearchaeota archaeon]|nr:PD-(D/E)XK nuclease family protein [Candidatus Woesearchaeota archaeon]
MTIKVSPSSLNLFLECPRCFWMQVIKNVKRPSGPFPSLPSGMDIVIKKHFDSFMERGELPPELRKEDCIKGCTLFDDKETLKTWRNNFQGIQHTDKETGILLHGAIDTLLVHNGKLIVLDFKTRGFPLKEDTHENYQTQMDMYNFLLRANGYATENYAYLLFYYPDKVTEKGDVIFETKLVKISIDSERGEFVFKRAIDTLQHKEPPVQSEQCEFCKWANKY